MDANNHIFNSEFALRQFNGSIPLLIKILDKFKLQYIHFDEQFAEHIKKGDIETIKRDVHTLKGISGNLGMEVLHQASKDFEPKLTTMLDEKVTAEFIEILNKTLEAIVVFTGSSDTNSEPKPEIETSSKQMLIEALKRNEFISDSKMQKFMQELDIESDTKEALIKAINDFDYANAIQILQ